MESISYGHRLEGNHGISFRMIVPLFFRGGIHPFVSTSGSVYLRYVSRAPLTPSTSALAYRAAALEIC